MTDTAPTTSPSTATDAKGNPTATTGSSTTASASGTSSDASTTDAGAAAALRYYVAPTQKDATNTLQQPLLPRGCWRMDDHQFDFGSSFMMPECAEDFPRLFEARKPEDGDGPAKGLLISIFGHADATGADESNKQLSGRRAKSLYGLLVRDTSVWEDLFTDPLGLDKWGTRHIQIMLRKLGIAVPVTGSNDTATRQAVVNFQEKRGLPQSGKADAGTRAKLFEAYMDALCVKGDGKPFRYRKQDFLGKGEDPKGKAAYQGCGEFNPALVLSKKKTASLKDSPEKRNLANRGNRRVLVYLFDPTLRFKLDKWPCPRVNEKGDGCKKMFWSDGEDRRGPTERERLCSMGGGTFACRWYDGIARYMPCEGVRHILTVWLLDTDHRRMPHARFRATVGKATIEGIADDQGRATLSNVLPPGECTLEWGGEGDRYEHHATLALHFDDEAPDEHSDSEAKVRLYNLGYRKPTLAESVAAFQRDYGLPENPWPDEKTKKALWDAHTLGGEAPSRKKESSAAGDEPFIEPLELHPGDMIPTHLSDHPDFDPTGVHDDHLDDWLAARAAEVSEAMAREAAQDESKAKA